MDPTAAETPTPAGEDKSPVQTGASHGTSAETTSTPDYFGDKFDPSTLDEALQPGWKSLQADYTRKMQEIAEQRKQAEGVTALISDLQSEDPQARANAVHWLASNGLLSESDVASVFGYEFEDDNEDDPLAAMQARIDNLEGNLSQREQQAATNEYVQAVDQHLVSEIEQLNQARQQQGLPELSERQQRLVVKNALVDTDPGSYPDVKAAYEDLAGALDEGVQAWRQTKTGGATHGGGSAATQVPDLDNMTRAQRQAWMTEQYQALSEQSGP